MKKQGIIAASFDLNEIKRPALLLLVATGMYLLFYSQASATPVAEVLCSVAAMIFIDVGRAIATLAIITLGISALLGKATWAQALTICTGIGIMVGAPYLMVSLTVSAATVLSTIGPGISSPFSLISAGGALLGCMR
jgi:type IV secretory pathway VirB2 component (pilin)